MLREPTTTTPANARAATLARPTRAGLRRVAVALCLTAAALLDVAVSTAPQAPDAAAMSECDRLAGHPSDPDKVGAGVARSAIDIDRATAACRADLAREPGNARFQYQFGRVLFYAQRADEALPHLEASAKAGHRQAQFVYGYLFVEGQGGLPKDTCRAEAPWRDAAQRGHMASRVSYARLWLRGAFDHCASGKAAREAVEGFLIAAQREATDYYQGLLITDLLDELRRR